MNKKFEELARVTIAKNKDVVILNVNSEYFIAIPAF